MNKQNILRLVKLAEREQRYAPKQDGTWYYKRPALAGAFIRNNKTCISNGCWGVIFDEVLGFVDHLKLRENETIALEKVIPEKLVLIQEKINTDINCVIYKIEDQYYRKDFIDEMLKVVGKPVEFYFGIDKPGCKYKKLIIKSPKATAIIAPSIRNTAYDNIPEEVFYD